MIEWMKKSPILFLAAAWFLSFLVGPLFILLVYFLMGTIFGLDQDNLPPLVDSLALLSGFILTGILSGMATVSLIKVRGYEIGSGSSNLIVVGWAITVSLAAIFFFMFNVLVSQ